jgi:DNA-binding CsgD family transcriptional regulator
MTLIDLQAGRQADTGTHLEEAVALASRIGDRTHVIECLDACGHLCAAAEDRVMPSRCGPRMPRAIGELDWQVFRAPSSVVRSRWAKGRPALAPTLVQAAEERGAAMTLPIAAEFAAILSAAGTRQKPRRPEQLSNREQELVILVAQGRTDAQIAGELHISIRTVRSHLDRIQEKTGCRRRADLTRLALQAGLV